METILITGGTGLIGSHLSKKLKEKGYNVVLLSRKSKPGNSYSVYSWNPDKNEIENEAIKSADYIIHLAGAGIGDKRWTKKRRQLIIDSRVRTSELIFNKVRESGRMPKAFITASGIGYYGATTSDKIFSESDPPARRLHRISLQPMGKFGRQISRQWNPYSKNQDRYCSCSRGRRSEKNGPSG